MSALSPQVNGVKVEHARIRIRLGESAFDQIRQQFIEASEGEVSPPRCLLGRNVAWIDAVTDLCLSRVCHLTIMFLLTPGNTSRFAPTPQWGAMLSIWNPLSTYSTSPVIALV